MPRAASLATKILDRYKGRVAEVALIPASGGAFEVKVGDELVYSKLAAGTFPSEAAVMGNLDVNL
ncbi:MAG: Rdx family protein [Chloroflexota bacterium]